MACFANLIIALALLVLNEILLLRGIKGISLVEKSTIIPSPEMTSLSITIICSRAPLGWGLDTILIFWTPPARAFPSLLVFKVMAAFVTCV